MIISDGKKIKVYNGTADTISSSRIVIVKGKKAIIASYNNNDCKVYPLGYTLENISPGQYGEVVLEGSILNINTESLGVVNSILYLDTNGHVTITKPTVPIIIGTISKSDLVTGEIYFRTFTPSTATWGDLVGNITDQSDLQDALDDKQDVLISGTTIKTINGNSLLGSGDLTITGGGGGIPKGTAAGTDTYTTTISGVTSYVDGDAYLIRFTNGNTTTSTLNINSIGAVTLYKNNDGPIVPGDILAGAEMLCVYNLSTPSFQCIGTSPNTLLSYVTNDDTVTINKGQPVYASGGVGDRLKVKLASNLSDATSAQTIGLVFSTSIAAGQQGIIIMQGLLTGLSTLPTSTWADSDPVYLGATAGSITKTKPYAPNHLVYLGFVTSASNGNAGRLYVRVQNGYEMDELHDVSAQNPNGGDTLIYNKDNNLWEAKAVVVPAGMTWMGAFPG